MSERLGYAITSDRGIPDSFVVSSSGVRPDARHGVPQPTIKTQVRRQSVLCWVGAWGEDSPQSESPAACSIGDSIAGAASIDA